MPSAPCPAEIILILAQLGTQELGESWIWKVPHKNLIRDWPAIFTDEQH